MPRTRNVLWWMLLGLLLGTLACLRKGSSGDHQQNRATQESRDERTRDQVAGATARAKQESKELGRQLNEAGKKLEHKAKIVAQGVREGLKYPLDLNSASESDLEHLPGLGPADASAIVRRRPYNTSRELVSKRILSETQYERIKNLVTVN